jgi:hypothetical protein
LTAAFRELRAWPARRWGAALLATGAYVLLIGIPTDLIDTPVFSREIPPTWWSWPALLLSSVLAGLLTATYVRTPDDAQPDRASRQGMAGGLLTLFAVGCPVCNKLVLVALGSAGAMTWFEPVQPVLQVLAVAILVWALQLRLRNATSCSVPMTPGRTLV